MLGPLLEGGDWQDPEEGGPSLPLEEDVPSLGKGSCQKEILGRGQGCSGVKVRPGKHLEGVDFILLHRRALGLGQRSPFFSPFNPRGPGFSTQGV